MGQIFCAILNRFQKGPACNVNEKLYQIVQKSRWPSLLSDPQNYMCYFNSPSSFGERGSFFLFTTTPPCNQKGVYNTPLILQSFLLRRKRILSLSYPFFFHRKTLTFFLPSSFGERGSLKKRALYATKQALISAKTWLIDLLISLEREKACWVGNKKRKRSES